MDFRLLNLTDYRDQGMSEIVGLTVESVNASKKADHRLLDSRLMAT